MSDPRSEAWEAEDRTEGLDVPGTRKDIGVSSEDRTPLPAPAGAEDRGTAGSLAAASTDTSVESADEPDRGEPLHPPA